MMMMMMIAEEEIKNLFVRLTKSIVKKNFKKGKKNFCNTFFISINGSAFLLAI